MIHKLVVSTLEHQINQALHGDQSRLEALNQMSGKKIAIALKGFEFKFTFLPDNQKVRVLDDYKGEVDVLISSPPFSLLRLLLETTASHNPDVIITGDKTIGLQ
ncbi:MAG: SCP2 sterol-binding domain-containing protein, partial [Thiomargarita sp.]|nr:SCP2 sterol-binding domain-containing protein [Thiomargarita sp.]